MKIAFIGLGVMGAPMAGHLVKAGHDVRAFNRGSERAQAWTQRFGLKTAGSVEAAAAGVDLVVSCVGADADVEEVFTAALPGLPLGGVFVDHTTASAELARRLAAQAAETGRAFLDAPVSGGQAGAENARLTAMIGGDAQALAKAGPALQAYCANITHVGGPGAGQLAKMVNQICIAGVLAGLSEGLAFAKAAGLDAERLIAAISKGSAQSWQMENRWKTMIAGEFEFGFAVDWMRKDLGLVQEEAARIGASAEITQLVDAWYGEVQAMGGARWDTSSLIARFNKAERGKP